MVRYLDKQTAQQAPSFSERSIEQFFAIEVHQIEREEADVHLDGLDDDVLAGAVGQDLKGLELAGLTINGHHLAFDDEAADTFASDLRHKRYQIRVLVRHDLKM